MEHIREEQLALYAGGDLLPEENSAIAAHVQGCGQCQTVLAEFHEARSFVTSSLQDPEASQLSEVRTRLLEKLQPPRSSRRHWDWWAAGVAAALALFILPRGFQQRPVVVRRVEPLTASLAVPEKAKSESPKSVAIAHTRRLRPREAGIRAVTWIAQAGREPIIKMTTADPDVVILWQMNKRTE